MITRVLLCLAATTVPLAAQEGSRPVDVGLRSGIEVHRGGFGQTHLGLQAWIPGPGGLDIVPSLDLLPGFPDDRVGAWTGRAFRAYVTARGRPFGRRWLPDIGYGVTAYYARARDGGRALTVSRFDLTDTAVLAFAGPRWRLRPYAEVHLVNIVRRAGDVGGHLFVGLRGTVR